MNTRLCLLCLKAYVK